MKANSVTLCGLLKFESQPARMETLSLDKTWKIKLDPSNAGLVEQWFITPEKLEEDCAEISVPSCWEEDFEDYEGVAWYFTSVAIDSKMQGLCGRICFEASNYRTQVWINGQSVGQHDGGYNPFQFEISDVLSYGTENKIVVRVLSPIVTKDLRIDDLGPNEMPHWRGGLTAGIWQSVSLQFNQTAWIESAFYQPDIEKSQFDLELSVQSKAALEAKVEVELLDATGEVVFNKDEVHCLEAGVNSYKTAMPLANPILWSIENPHLYTAKVRLLIDGEPCAQHQERIGLRAFTYVEGRFYLNGEHIYLCGGFWEGVYAKHQSYPENREVIKKEIRLAKAAGLNLLRPWRRPVPPIILEEADAAGLLIIASPAVECMSCWPALTPETPKRIDHEIRQLVLRDRNHPSIIWWEMFNEVTRKEIAALITPMALIARELDPTRLILDESGGWANGAHFYLPHSTQREALTELHSYVRAPVSDKHWKLYQTLGNQDTEEGNTKIKAGAGLFVSEFGFGGWPEFEANCAQFQAEGNPKLPAYRHHHKILKDLRDALKSCELDTIYPETDAFCRESQVVQARGNQHQLEALLANRNISGYCIHAFTDGDWILGAGLIDNWQRPKAVYHAIAESNSSPRLLCFPEQRNIWHGESVTCNFVLRSKHAELPHGIVLYGEGTHHVIPSTEWGDASNLSQITATIPASLLHEGRNTLKASAVNESGTSLCEAGIELFVLAKLKVEQGATLVVYDPNKEITPFLALHDYTFVDPDKWVPGNTPIVLLFVPQDVRNKADLEPIARILNYIEAGKGSAIFLEAPADRNSPAMLKEYNAAECIPVGENLLLNSGTFPYDLNTRPSFSFWESSMHFAKTHPIFNGLPQDCMMDEPYHEIAPAESYYQLESLEAPAQTITWFRPEDEDKVRKRTYLGGEALWYGTDVAVKAHGKGSIILSTLILRGKVSQDPVAARLLHNFIQYGESLISENACHSAQLA